MNTVEKSKKIQEFLKYKEGNTKKSYINSLKKFLKWFDKKYPKTDFDSYLKDIRLMEIKEKIATTDQYEKDILDYLKELKTKYTPKTIATDIAIVKGLLRKCRIDLDNAFWDDVRNLSPGTATTNDVIVSSQKELKEILTHANTRQRAIFMTMITSGTRLIETCSLKLKDDGRSSYIDLNHTYPRITIRYGQAKNKANGRTRISPEAKSCIVEWLKIRDDEIIKSYKRQMNFKTVPKIKDFTEAVINEIVKKEDRLFPFHGRTIEREWNELLAKAKYDEKNAVSPGHTKARRHKRNVHTLRKVFRSQIGMYNDDLGEFLINHVSELRSIYDVKGDEWLDQEYGKGLRYLTIFETVMDESDRIKRINKQMKEKDQTITEMQKRIDSLEDKYGDLLHEIVMKKKD